MGTLKASVKAVCEAGRGARVKLAGLQVLLQSGVVVQLLKGVCVLTPPVLAMLAGGGDACCESPTGTPAICCPGSCGAEEESLPFA
jgi:hypothetical protein